MRLNKNIKIFLNYFLGPVLFLWLSYSIYNQVKHQPDLETSWKKIKQSLQSAAAWDLLAVIILMIINWSIEAWKWKISIEKVQPVSFSRSFRAVLSGVSFSVSTPNRIGEYLGRILYMEEGNRLRVISLTIVSSISQLIITLVAGSVGLYFIRKNIESGGLVQGLDSFWLQILQYGVIVVLLILTGFYFRLSFVISLVDKLRNSNRYSWLISSLNALINSALKVIRSI